MTKSKMYEGNGCGQVNTNGWISHPIFLNWFVSPGVCGAGLGGNIPYCFALALYESDYLSHFCTMCLSLEMFLEFIQFLWSGEFSQSKLAPSNLGAVRAANARLYHSSSEGEYSLLFLSIRVWLSHPALCNASVRDLGVQTSGTSVEKKMSPHESDWGLVGRFGCSQTLSGNCLTSYSNPIVFFGSFSTDLKQKRCILNMIRVFPLVCLQTEFSPSKNLISNPI